MLVPFGRGPFLLADPLPLVFAGFRVLNLLLRARPSAKRRNVWLINWADVRRRQVADVGVAYRRDVEGVITQRAHLAIDAPAFAIGMSRGRQDEQ